MMHNVTMAIMTGSGLESSDPTLVPFNVGAAVGVAVGILAKTSSSKSDSFESDSTEFIAAVIKKVIHHTMYKYIARSVFEKGAASWVKNIDKMECSFFICALKLDNHSPSVLGRP